MFRNPYHLFVKILVGYYGALQVAHFYILARAAILYQQTGRFGFPASPPEFGWNTQAVPFLMATGGIDALNAILIVLFVFGYFRKKWWWRPLGLVTLVISSYSAVLYGAGTVPAGVWQIHAPDYWGVAAAFSPVFVLMVFYFAWSMDRRFWHHIK